MQDDDDFFELGPMPPIRPKPLSPDSRAKDNKVKVDAQVAMGELDPEQAQQVLDVLNGCRKED